MKKKILIIGYGSIGKRHANIISQNFSKFSLYIYTSQLKINYNTINSNKEMKVLNPDYIIICSETHKHYKQLNFIEKSFKNKKILVEKPLFHKIYNYNTCKNKVFVGYNLRFHPFLCKLKKEIKNFKIWSVNINCSSFLPDWRKNMDYSNSYSASKKKGGGVLLDLSHELDYLVWIFGEIKNFSKKIVKVSNLKINSEDYASVIGTTKKNIVFNLCLNYFSKIGKREILVEGKDISIKIDLIKNSFLIIKKGKKISNNLKNLDLNFTYKSQLKSFLNNEKSQISTYKEAYQIIKIINILKIK